jgi:hypothetical protein
MIANMKILITGDREWSNPELIGEVLSTYGKNTIVIHGNCRGADKMAGLSARKLGLEVKVYPAQWGYYHKAAGPIRNQQMLDYEHPDRVIAFHDHLWDLSKGTKDMVQRAMIANIEVCHYKSDGKVTILHKENK